MTDNLVQTAKNGKSAVEGILAEEEFKNGMIIVTIIFPLSVRHGDLIEIRE